MEPDMEPVAAQPELDLGDDVPPPELPFADRADAGRLLARRLASTAVPRDALVLGVPRGGLPVAAIVATELGCALDVVIAHKIGAPLDPELAVGAVSEDGSLVVESWASDFGADEDYLRAEGRRQIEIARERGRRLRPGRPEPLAGRTVIVVDDGMATGATVVAALRACRRAGAARCIVAAPVASREAVERLRPEADEVVVLATPDPFDAVGLWYRRFESVPDEAVAAILAGRTGDRRDERTPG